MVLETSFEKILNFDPKVPFQLIWIFTVYCLKFHETVSLPNIFLNFFLFHRFFMTDFHRCRYKFTLKICLFEKITWFSIGSLKIKICSLPSLITVVTDNSSTFKDFCRQFLLKFWKIINIFGPILGFWKPKFRKKLLMWNIKQKSVVSNTSKSSSRFGWINKESSFESSREENTR